MMPILFELLYFFLITEKFLKFLSLHGYIKSFNTVSIFIILLSFIILHFRIDFFFSIGSVLFMNVFIMQKRFFNFLILIHTKTYVIILFWKFFQEILELYPKFLLFCTFIIIFKNNIILIVFFEAQIKILYFVFLTKLQMIFQIKINFVCFDCRR